MTGGCPPASTPGRAANMRAIHRRDTKPERQLSSALHALGYRFRRDFPIRIGKVTVRPDIVFTRKHVAIFLDGCFWHGCPEHGHRPSVHQSYWNPKLERNHARDVRNNQSLEDAGWTVIRFWEHEELAEEVEHARIVLGERRPR
ncbi:Putative DNA mismatch endonuclease [Acidipropionibacterium acidipropionici ATCC 4875]|uniref:DNA mismatch endonuclease n=1 Tax=Acidipropionibacterium acidipropionici (strain ATCC 4875 / DSM 20272 / JCM 6432 / NBRC 12425 / NCIMB 8070 / 4) TaxID=1171373 RepID=K7SF82_ACIA4|nr:very short patch repair endonuclease [Acidipropionibacterium acidipropionici]AFV87945.1 Putative DNA mismatch endonuclease [Acidipropionibacterium acidipropionici ATCC 4875]